MYHERRDVIESTLRSFKIPTREQNVFQSELHLFWTARSWSCVRIFADVQCLNLCLRCVFALLTSAFVPEVCRDSIDSPTCFVYLSCACACNTMLFVILCQCKVCLINTMSSVLLLTVWTNRTDPTCVFIVACLLELFCNNLQITF